MERPILFSAPMVRAILDGRKTQTRRVLKPQPSKPSGGFFCDGMKWWTGDSLTGDVIESLRIPYSVGDRLWVREAFSYSWLVRDDPDRRHLMPVWYWADDNPKSGSWSKPKPSIHMPRWASRIILDVTDVRLQRLHDIRYLDTIAEGIEATDIHERREKLCLEQSIDCGSVARDSFQELWTTLHGPGSWEVNPWVVALTFERVK